MFLPAEGAISTIIPFFHPNKFEAAFITIGQSEAIVLMALALAYLAARFVKLLNTKIPNLKRKVNVSNQLYPAEGNLVAQ